MDREKSEETTLEEVRAARKILEEDVKLFQERRLARQRRVARQCLFFLELVHPVRDCWCARRLRAQEAVDGYCGMALRQVEKLAAPRLPNLAEGQLEEAHRTLAERAGEPKSRAEAVRAESRQAFEHAQEVWPQISEGLRLFGTERTDRAFPETGGVVSEEAPPAPRRCLAAAAEAREKVHEFLRLSERVEPSRPRRLFAFWLQDALAYLHKNLTLLLAIPLALYVAFGVEAVRSLLFNDPLFALLAAALVAAPPVAVRLRLAWLQRGRDDGSASVPWWDLSGIAFRSLRPPAVEPERIARWPWRSGAREATDREDGAPDSLMRQIRRLFPPAEGAKLPRILFYGQLLQLFWHVVSWLVIGTVIYFVPALGQPQGPAQPYLTVYVILSILMAILIGARTIDRWDFFHRKPIRVWAIVAALAATILVALGREALFGPLLALASIAFLISWWRNRARISRLVVFVVLLGLGIAAFWKDDTRKEEIWKVSDYRSSSSELRRLCLGPGSGSAPGPECPEALAWPKGGSGDGPVVVMAASGGGSRAALFTGLTFQHLESDFPAIAEQLQAVSSVSGGSLANAAYIVRRLRHEEGENSRRKHWDDLIEALRGDFLRPTLLGAFLPGTSRGRAIEKHWNRSTVGRIRENPGDDLRNARLSDLIKGWRKAGPDGLPPFPIPLFNTTTLDGHALVVTPLKKTFYTRPDLPTLSEPPPDGTWVYDRDGIYGLESLLPGYDPEISSAVRASASFPFGFPVVWIKTRKPLDFSPLVEDRLRDREKDVYLTDGGALSNSGFRPLYRLLTRERLRAILRSRGVLVVVVNASKMPDQSKSKGRYRALLGTIQAQEPLAQALHRQMLDSLETIYGDRLALTQLDLPADEEHNVLTTWALSESSFTTLENGFDASWKLKRAYLCSQWRSLTGEFPNDACDSWVDEWVEELPTEPPQDDEPPKPPQIDRARPPLD